MRRRDRQLVRKVPTLKRAWWEDARHWRKALNKIRFPRLFPALDSASSELDSSAIVILKSRAGGCTSLNTFSQRECLSFTKADMDMLGRPWLPSEAEVIERLKAAYHEKQLRDAVHAEMILTMNAELRRSESGRTLWDSMQDQGPLRYLSAHV